MQSSKFACAPLLGALGAPDRCTARGRRLLQVKFVAFSEPVEPSPAPSRLSSVLTRVLGFLAVARR
jgi:hypothetical protein